MPILDAEVNILPPDLLDAQGDASLGRRWLAVYTKPRQEKALGRDLVARMVPFYLPLVAKDRKVQGRRIQSLIPLFGGYVFVFGNESERVATLTTNRVSQILHVEDQDQLYIDLKNLHRLISSDAPVALERRLEPGRAVRIKSGPMEGTEGQIISRRGKDRLLVAVNLLQQGVSVEIEDFLVEPIY